MAGNTFGRVFKLITFGESHGPAIGGVIDGCPAGIMIDPAAIQQDLDLRKPGSGTAGTRRKEQDRIELLSGIFEGQTTGTPIGFIIANEDQRSRDYSEIADVFRPGHADWSYFCKYNGIRDYRGGGRASGRETACRVAGGAIAKALLTQVCNSRILAGCIEFGGIAIPENRVDLENCRGRPYFAAADDAPALWDAAVERARAAGDTLGGVVRIVAENVPAGLGEPVFDKLDAALGHALLSVGAVKGVEIGSGFSSARMTGSQHNDMMLPGPMRNGLLAPAFSGNNAGGILGGISTGQPIVLQAAVKPIASISAEQETIDCKGNARKIRIAGRHDLSAIPRVVPVLSAMTALALADALLMQSHQGLKR